MTFPTTEDYFLLDTNASANGIGHVLSQVHDGHERVICYASKTLNQAEKRYCTTKRELLAVVYFVKHFNHYLWGRYFTVRPDHSSLTWIKNFKDPIGILARWLSILKTYDFKTEHRKGVKHANADALSCIPIHRCPCQNCPDCSKNLSARVNPIAINQSTENTESSANNLGSWMESLSTAEIKNLQENDPSLKPIIDLKTEYSEKPSRSVLLSLDPETKILFSVWETLEIKDELLYYINLNITGDKKYQLVAPFEFRQKILEQLHNNRTAGHLGRDKTISSVKQRYYWIGLNSDVQRWCLQCDQCARRKPGPGIGASELQSSKIEFPLQRIAIDILGPLPTTSNGNEYIMVVGDYFTKWKESYALPNHTAYTVADKLCTEFLCKYRVPRVIQTDQGREFESLLFTSLCKNLGVEKTRTTPYRPKSNGMVERFNRTLQDFFRANIIYNWL